jgi:hypothetical protein
MRLADAGGAPHDGAVSVEEQIEGYIARQPDAKRSDMEALHHRILGALPAAKLWFLDGKNSDGKVVSNPNIGYGSRTMTYADGSSREFYQIGISANTSGVSVYVLGLDDKNYLADTFGKDLGKASVSGYCIKFRALQDIDVDVLEKAIRAGVEATS